MKKIFSAALVAGSLLATPALADVMSVFSGDTTGGPTWNRPVGMAPPPASGVGTAVPYQAVPLSSSESGDYFFLVERTGAAFWDTYLFLYAGSFDPLDQFTNRVAANDDCGAFDRSCFDVTLDAGTLYIAVVTGFDNSSFGTYDLSIRGPGGINFNPGGGVSVPEPATLAMLIAGLGLVGAGRRRCTRLASA